MSETPESISWDELTPEMQHEVLRRRQEKANGNYRSKAEVRFYTPNVNQVEHYAPIPGLRAIPGWIKAAPLAAPDAPPPTAVGARSHNTVRRCPGIIDYLGLGYVLPLWSDVVIAAEKDHPHAIEAADPATHASIFPGGQSPGMPKRDPDGTDFHVKLGGAWAMVTPPGWSTLMLPPEYDLDDRFDITPGVWDTDILHDITVIFRWNATDGQRHLLKAGTPLCRLIPFKRADLSAEAIHDPGLFAWYDQRGRTSVGQGTVHRPFPYRTLQREVASGAPIANPPGAVPPVEEPGNAAEVIPHPDML